MQIDDGDGSTPQFISDDHEVEAFVKLRWKIEKVNLFVTISHYINLITKEHRKPHFSNLTNQTLLNQEDGDISYTDGRTDEEWMAFAMSETRMTCPHEQNSVVGSFHVRVTCTTPQRGNGVEIREQEGIIWLRSPTNLTVIRGKRKAVVTEAEKDRDEDAYLLPQNLCRKATSRWKGNKVASLDVACFIILESLLGGTGCSRIRFFTREHSTASSSNRGRWRWHINCTNSLD